MQKSIKTKHLLYQSYEKGRYGTQNCFLGSAILASLPYHSTIQEKRGIVSGERNFQGGTNSKYLKLMLNFSVVPSAPGLSQNYDVMTHDNTISN